MRQIVPGLAFAIALAVAARLVYHATGDMVSPTLVAIAVGVAWRNLVGVGAWAEPGLEYAGRTLLRIGIALIGLRLTLMVLADVSMIAIPIVLSCVAAAIGSAVLLGRALGVDATMRRLLAAGTAICGCTAIIATAPLLRARKADIGIAMTCVVLFGSIAMMGYPWIAGALFGDDVRSAGMFFGASIHDTSQVIGAALIYADVHSAPDAVAIAGLTKFLRTLGLLLLVPIAAWLSARDAAAAGERPGGLRRKALPAFVIWFVLLVALRTAGDAYAGEAGALAGQWQQVLAAGQAASEWLLLVGMAAIGLGVTFAHLREAGWRPVALAFGAALLAGLTALAWLL
ncbi:MAG: putative sulfate exporter family transporter [Steroidobacteraceae bacterium]|nr:putative sulfate exporter family transporter [Steroidobacteraceae bacterium]